MPDELPGPHNMLNQNAAEMPRHENSTQADALLTRIGFYDYSDLSEVDKERITRGIRRDHCTQTYATTGAILSDPENSVPKLLAGIQTARAVIKANPALLANFLDDPSVDLSGLTEQALTVVLGQEAPTDDPREQQAVVVVHAVRAVKAATQLRWLKNRGEFSNYAHLEQEIENSISGTVRSGRL